MFDSNKTYQFKDLVEWQESPCLAVIGQPIEHSLSPRIHNFIYSQLRSPFDRWRYYKFDIEPDQLGAALVLFREKGFVGLNVTAPHKINILKYLTDIDTVAQSIGAVNTIFFKKDKVLGFNTDAFGVLETLRRKWRKPIPETDAIILGAGGAARTAISCLLQESIRSLWVGNRSCSGIERLTNHLGDLSRLPIKFFLLEEIPYKTLPPNALVLNASLAGSEGNQYNPLDLTRITPSFVFDLVYSPRKTALIGQAEALRIPYCNGLPMLIAQALKAIEIWTSFFQNI
ncbi:MAG: hypothetical protein A2007_01485 [Verrucomicrobia bacterium GWC2_42_7]|nr:MAG: hypothetical protein A2007_01485 [Verrucomicrobia bacterium GWC2_42_7]